MDGSKIKQKNAGKGSIHSKSKKVEGASQTAGMKGKTSVETERHKTFHGHASKMRTSAGC